MDGCCLDMVGVAMEVDWWAKHEFDVSHSCSGPRKSYEYKRGRNGRKGTFLGYLPSRPICRMRQQPKNGLSRSGESSINWGSLSPFECVFFI